MECSINEFILQCALQDVSICDEIIDYHKNSNRKVPGLCGGKKYYPEIKKSTDVILDFDSLVFRKYSEQLQNVVDLYISNFEFCNTYSGWTIIEHASIQHYLPEEGFKAWHTERCSSHSPSNNRHLVFMTYLNDVDDKGETEWFYQKIKVKPKKGLTVIWPADWTYTHRGIVSPTQEKYIITGWFSFFNKENL
jgi:hypothetical protein